MNKKNLIRLILTVAIITVFVTSAICVAFSPKKNLKPSEYNLGTTYELAMQSKKPFIAVFYSDWCGYCVQSMPKYETLADIYKDKYNFVMVNTDDPALENLVRSYYIGSLPTIYIVDPTIDNRIHITAGIYNDLTLLRVEFDRYLRVRAMINK